MERFEKHDATNYHHYEYHAIEINSIILNLHKDRHLGETNQYANKFMYLIKALGQPHEIDEYESYKIIIQQNLRILIDALKQTNNISNKVRENLNAQAITDIIGKN
jgi:hypothetical protein